MNHSISRILVVVILLIPVLVSGQKNQTNYKELKLSSSTKIPYAVHLPNGFDSAKTYPVLIGPGDGIKGESVGFYWRTDPYSHGWIIVDAQLWESDTKKGLNKLLDQILKDYKVEGNKFHTVCWSANSAGIFSLTIDHADRFHSITGMAGNPGSLSKKDIVELKKMKVQFVVGEDDPYWQKSARDANSKLKAAGVNTTLEIISDGKHVMTELIGKGFMQKLEKLRSK